MTDQRLHSLCFIISVILQVYNKCNEHKFASLALIQVSEAEAICSSLLKEHDIYSCTVSEHKTAFK